MAGKRKHKRRPRQLDGIETPNEDFPVRIGNKIRNSNSITGCRDIFNNNSVTNVVLVNVTDVTNRALMAVLEAPRTEQACAIHARIGAYLNAAGVAPDEFRAASNTVATAGEACRASTGRAVEQHALDISMLDFIRAIPLPGMRELRLAWSLVLHSLSELRALTHEANRKPAITAVVGVTLLVVHDRRIRMACAALSVGLYALGKPYMLFKSPNVSHFVVIIDLFDREVQIPLSKATSSSALHRALTRHFEGKIVLPLLQQRKYELQVSQESPGLRVRSGQALPRGWKDLLRPGSKLSMNALLKIMNRKDLSRIICPACMAPFPRGNNEDLTDWLECPRCPCKVQISEADDEILAFTDDERKITSLSEDLSEDNTVDGTAGLHLAEKEAEPDIEQHTASLEEVLRHCRRIRMIGALASKPMNPDDSDINLVSSTETDIINPDTAMSNQQHLPGSPEFDAHRAASFHQGVSDGVSHDSIDYASPHSTVAPPDRTRRTPLTMPPALPMHRDTYLHSTEGRPRIFSSPLRPDEDEILETYSVSKLKPFDRVIRRGTVAAPSTAVQSTPVKAGRPRKKRKKKRPTPGSELS